ncbi:hypothetical protein [Lysobacter gummosus]|uniref:hypothetical protein n=2 Tax=Lysobacter gummosus TaxID=262324 RepID=UPI0036312072
MRQGDGTLCPCFTAGATRWRGATFTDATIQDAARAMSDLIDQAQYFEEINLAQSLQARKLMAEATARPAAAGYCLNQHCLEPFDGEPARLYCGPACAESHHRQMQRDRHRRPGG